MSGPFGGRGPGYRAAVDDGGHDVTSLSAAVALAAGPERQTFAIHATAVAVGNLALIIRGPSKAGKSTLALALIAASSPGRPIVLVGDDRVLLSRQGNARVVSPHPRIAGLIEKRGHGILSMPYREGVRVVGIVDLALDPSSDGRNPVAGDVLGENIPSLHLPNEHKWETRCGRVLAWFDATSTAQ